MKNKEWKEPKKYTLNQLVDRFFKSKYNRDPYYPVEESEDINKSTKHRLFNKKAIKELMPLFAEFLEWVLIEDNVSHITVSSNISLVRDCILPMPKVANVVDARILGDRVEVGKYYATRGRYVWKMWITKDLYEKSMELWELDPARIKRAEELVDDIKKRNENR